MINGIDYYYYWHHPEKYPRLKASDLSNEGTIELVEVLLDDLRQYYASVAKALHRFVDEEAVADANNLLRVLHSDKVDGLTLGHGREVANEFLSLCPSNLLKTNRKGEVWLECPRKDDQVAKEEGTNPGTFVEGGRS